MPTSKTGKDVKKLEVTLIGAKDNINLSVTIVTDKLNIVHIT